MFHLLIAVAVILTVIRHTRADEETGRTELIDSTAVGRYASLTAALLLCFGASIATGAIGAGGLLTMDIPHSGSLAFGAALAGSGLVFTAVAAVTAQLSPSARFARGAAFSVLGAAFTLRAIGDTGSGVLSWFSPLGWSLQVRPYAGDRWWVLVLDLATAAVLTAVAYRLLAGRDVGAGLIAERAGAGTAGARLRHVDGLTWRLDRGAVLVWTVGLCLYGVLMGSVVHGIGDELGDGTAARDIVARMGGTSAAGAGLHRGGVHHDGHGRRGVRHLADAAAAPGRSRPTGRDDVGGCGFPNSLAGKPFGGRAGWIRGGDAGRGRGGRTGLRHRGRRRRRQAGRSSSEPRPCSCPPSGCLSAVTVALFGLAPRFTPVAWGVLVGVHRRCT